RAAAEVKQFLQPAESIAAKHPEVADTLAPAFQASEQIEGAPDVTPAGAGVLEPGAAPGFGKDALRQARDNAIGEAAGQVREAEEAKRAEEHAFREQMMREQVRSRREAAALALMGRQDAMAAAAATKAAVLRPPEAKELDSLSDTISLAESIKAAKSGGVDTGPAASFLNRWAAKFGLDDPKTSAFYSAAKDQLSAYIRQISGTAASDKEREFLQTVIPSPTDNDQVFSAKLDRFLGKVKEIRDRRLSTLSRQGRDVSAYTESTMPGQPSAGAAGPASDDTVTLVLPDGRRKRAPRADAEALAAKIPGARIEP
ncbi:MAG TPA: hypothetical protein VFN94_10825, partial [Nitrospiria bacterium]|nr:hypothetical protein [Nitrospiria bacterium]